MGEYEVRLLFTRDAGREQEEIAEREDCDQKTITNVISGETADPPEFLKLQPAASHVTDCEVLPKCSQMFASSLWLKASKVHWSAQNDAMVGVPNKYETCSW
jgi:hypothetical protein